jgi:hypothetical protein
VQATSLVSCHPELYLDFYTAADALVSSASATVAVFGYVRASLATTVPANTSYAVARLLNRADFGGASGSVWFRNAMLEEHASATGRFTALTPPALCEVTLGEETYANTTATDGHGTMRTLLLTLREV